MTEKDASEVSFESSSSNKVQSENSELGEQSSHQFSNISSISESIDSSAESSSSDQASIEETKQKIEDEPAKVEEQSGVADGLTSMTDAQFLDFLLDVPAADNGSSLSISELSGINDTSIYDDHDQHSEGESAVESLIDRRIQEENQQDMIIDAEHEPFTPLWMGDFTRKYQSIREESKPMTLRDHPYIRTPVNDIQMRHQSSPIQATLMDINTQMYDGDNYQVLKVTNLCVDCFNRCLLAIGGDLTVIPENNHYSVQQLVKEYILTMQRDEWTQQEMFAQMIKQTTDVEDPVKSRNYWRMMYLICMNNQPSPPMTVILKQHISKHNPTCFGGVIGYSSISDLSALCFKMIDPNSRMKTRKIHPLSSQKSSLMIGEPIPPENVTSDIVNQMEEVIVTQDHIEEEYQHSSEEKHEMEKEKKGDIITITEDDQMNERKKRAKQLSARIHNENAQDYIDDHYRSVGFDKHYEIWQYEFDEILLNQSCSVEIELNKLFNPFNDSFHSNSSIRNRMILIFSLDIMEDGIEINIENETEQLYNESMISREICLKMGLLNPEYYGLICKIHNSIGNEVLNKLEKQMNQWFSLGITMPRILREMDRLYQNGSHIFNQMRYRIIMIKKVYSPLERMLQLESDIYISSVLFPLIRLEVMTGSKYTLTPKVLSLLCVLEMLKYQRGTLVDLSDLNARRLSEHLPIYGLVSIPMDHWKELCTSALFKLITQFGIDKLKSSVLFERKYIEIVRKSTPLFGMSYFDIQVEIPKKYSNDIIKHPLMLGLNWSNLIICNKDTFHIYKSVNIKHILTLQFDTLQPTSRLTIVYTLDDDSHDSEHSDNLMNEQMRRKQLGLVSESKLVLIIPANKATFIAKHIQDLRRLKSEQLANHHRRQTSVVEEGGESEMERSFDSSTTIA